jgi:hypothetical protein
VGHRFDRLGKGHALLLHQEGENAAAGGTPETVEDPLFRVDAERGGFFGVKRTQPDVVPAGFFQDNGLGDDLDDIGGIADL